jgi:hypothetical protein
MTGVVQWLRLALSKGPNWGGISRHTWGRKQIEFPKHSVTCYLLTRRIILWVADCVSRFIGYYIRRCLQSLKTFPITSHEPANSSGSSSAPSWRKPLLRIFRDELLFQTAMTTPPAYIISAIHCWSVRCQDICISTDRCLVVTITPLFRWQRVFWLQNSWEHFGWTRGYIILSVAWQWVFHALGNSAFQTTCHNSVF